MGAGALKTLAESRSLALPLKLFEVGDVVLLDGGAEAGARNERRLCAVCCANSDTFEAMHGLLLWLMRALGVPCRLDGDGAPHLLAPPAHLAPVGPGTLHLMYSVHVRQSMASRPSSDTQCCRFAHEC